MLAQGDDKHRPYHHAACLVDVWRIGAMLATSLED